MSKVKKYTIIAALGLAAGAVFYLPYIKYILYDAQLARVTQAVKSTLDPDTECYTSFHGERQEQTLATLWSLYWEGEEGSLAVSALEEVEDLCRAFSISDRNLVKPGIGEATRVLLRRMPWKVLVHSLEDEAHLGHIYQLAKEKGVPLVEYPLVHYRACGLIRQLADS